MICDLLNIVLEPGAAESQDKLAEYLAAIV
jgi:hypothetical protein